MLKKLPISKTERPKKISLPGAIFNHPCSTLSPSQNNSLISNNSTLQMTCQNHPEKKGKYRTVHQNDQTYFCEKCAVLVASRGFEIKKINETHSKREFTTIKVKREDELNQFIEIVGLNIEQVESKNRQMEEILRNLDQIFLQKSVTAKEFFQHLITYIENKKEDYLHYLSNRKLAIENNATCTLQVGQQKLDLLQNMKDDIISSHTSIIRETPEEDYQLVMQHYRQNIRQMRSQSLTTSIVLDQLPAEQTILQHLDNLIWSEKNNKEDKSRLKILSDRRNQI